MSVLYIRICVERGHFSATGSCLLTHGNRRLGPPRPHPLTACTCDLREGQSQNAGKNLTFDMTSGLQ